MYRKAAGGLALLNLIFLFGFLCVKGVSQNRHASMPFYQVKLDERVLASKEGSTLGIMDVAVSKQRMVDVVELRKSDHSIQNREELNHSDLEILARIVEAEAGDQDSDGRLLVANVVLNRVESEKFPDNVTDVVFQEENGVYQFSPVLNGSIWSVKVSAQTKEAVERALAGEDISDGALYFAARKYADSGKMKWFDEKLTYLFAYGGHEFFR